MDAPPAERAGSRSPPWQERLLRLLRYDVFIALAVLLCFLVGGILLYVFAGVLLAVLLRGLSTRLSEHTRLPLGLSLALVILLIIAGIAAAGYLLAPRTSEQLNQLATQLPVELQRIETPLEQSAWGKSLLSHFQPGAGGSAETQAMVGRVFGVASGTVDVIAAFVIVIFIGLYLAADPGTYLAGALRLVPPPRRPRISEVLHEIASILRWWLIGRILSMTIIAVLSAIGLWLLGIPLALILGILAGLLAFVPYVGSVTAAVPAILIGLAQSPQRALYVILLYLGIHLVEGYILVPLMQRRMVHMPPALTLAAQVIMGTLFGIVGLALATPLVAGSIAALRMLYVEDVLHDDTARSSAERRRPR